MQSVTGSAVVAATAPSERAQAEGDEPSGGVGGARVGGSVRVRGPLGTVIELTKPRITRLVTLTSVVGFGLHAVEAGPGAVPGAGGAWWLMPLLACAAGTALASAGANALNQCVEAPRDARMDRTRARPVPSGRLTPAAAAGWAWAMMLAGVALLGWLCGPAAALVAAVTSFTYVAIYTPLKPRTVLNTWVGAVPGALPPLIGWCASAWASAGGGAGAAWHAGLGDAGGWSLFALMFVWQIPHFFAIAWMHRDDYARGGFRMLPIGDPSGRVTAWTIVLWAVLLLPASLAPAWALPGRVGVIYAAAALLSGLAFAGLAATLIRDRTRGAARRVFFASIMHLPLLLVVMVAEAAWRAWGG